MAQTQTTCPRCRQPILAEVEKLFDLNVDPQAKQRLLSGAVNVARCPNCGFEGPINVPIVYHDPEKELLLTYFPPELGVPINEQEKLIGPMINQIVNKLPPEKRKAYILQPKTMLTMQTMAETILAADGITHEMLEAQQQKMNLLDRLLRATPDARAEILKQEDANMDQAFFTMFTQIVAGVIQQSDEATARQLAAIQKELLEGTTVGKQIKSQVEESEEAVKTLREASKAGLTREKLLDILIEAPTETRLSTLVSMARNGMDYNFFEILSNRITAAAGDEQKRLSDLRDKLLGMTKEYDQAVQSEIAHAQKLLETILSAPNIEEATMKNMDSFNDIFIQVLKTDLENVRQKGDLERGAKLQKIVSVLQEVSAPPKEYEFIEELLSAETEEGWQKTLNDHPEKVTPPFLELLNGVISQAESQEQEQPEELKARLQAIYRAALRISMKNNLSK